MIIFIVYTGGEVRDKWKFQVKITQQMFTNFRK